MNAVPIEAYKITHIWVNSFTHVERLRAQTTVIIWEPEKSPTIIISKDPQRRISCIADISVWMRRMILIHGYGSELEICEPRVLEEPLR